MALFWLYKTHTSATSAIKSAFSILVTLSSTSRAPSAEGAPQPWNALSLVSIGRLQDLSALLIPGLPSVLSSSTMTTMRPPLRAVGRVRRARESDHTSLEGDGDDSQPSCSYWSHLHRASGGQLRKGCPHTPAAGLSAGVTSTLQEGESNVCPSSSTGHNHPRSDESCHNPCRREAQAQQQELPRHIQHQQRQPHDEGAHPLSSLGGKSAKRRAAEALLAARLGGAISPDLSPYLPHALASAYLHPRRHTCVSACCVHLAANMYAVGSVTAATAARVPCCGCSGRGAHLSSCSAVLSDMDDDNGMTADGGPTVPAAAAAAAPTGSTTDDGEGDDGAEVASHAGVSTGLSALQRKVDSLAAGAVYGKVGKAAAKAASGLERARLSRVSNGITSASRPNVQAPGPPPKRARLSLSAAATSSLGAGLEAAAAAKAASEPERARPSRTATSIAAASRSALQVPGPPPKQASLSLSAAATSSLGAGLAVPAAAAMQLPPKAAKTTVPPCNPARGCKARLQEAAAVTAAALKRVRSGCSLAEEGGNCGNVGGSNGAGSSPEPGQAAAAAAGVSAAASGSGTPAIMEPLWCGFEVTLPSINWQAVFDEPPGALQRFSLARGYEKLLLPQGVVTYVVENERHLGEALRNLKAGMQDRLIAIDLEWRPETVSGRVSPVALLQLSSASVCLVVRTCCMGYDLPPVLRAFLEDPAHVLLGFGWDSADESKMRGTFGMGRADFRRFLDLQEVAASLGYHGFGLSRLSQQVLGLPLHKSKAISRSNWAAPQLTNHQLKYASLDVLVAGQLFRALRLWHSSPSPCADCRSSIGELLLFRPMRCGNPTCTARPATNLQHHRDHCAATGHPARFAACGTCGRVYELGVSS